MRAATPTAAAELATPSRENLLHALQQLGQQLNKNISYFLRQRAQALDYLARSLISPLQQIAQQKAQLNQIAYRLNSTMQQQLKTKQQHVLRLGQNLSHLNPQAVLTRGYAFVQNQSGEIISASAQLQSGDEVTLTFGAGAAEAIISKTKA
jgi:exodeoxyribonuclease VII large subunit